MFKILLDIDGVLNNFIRGACKIFNRDYDSLISSWPLGIWNMEVALNIPASEFYSTIDHAGIDFWANLPEFSHTRSMIKFCQDLAPTYLVTTPTLDPSCHHGKMIWIQNVFGRNFKDYVLTPRKELCAAPYHVLVDDNEENIKKFIINGGIGLLYPTVGNCRYEERFNPFEIIKRDLLDIKEKISGKF